MNHAAIDKLILVRPCAGHRLKDLHPEFRPSWVVPSSYGELHHQRTGETIYITMTFESPRLILFQYYYPTERPGYVSILLDKVKVTTVDI